MPRRQITWGEILDALAFGTLSNVHKVMPGKVVGYSAGVAGSSPPTVDVQPAVHDVRFDTELGVRVREEWPVLPDVPIPPLKMGGFTLAGPMKAGDGVLLLGFDLDPTAYRATGQPSDPIDTARHGGGFWIALPFDLTDGGALDDPGGDFMLGVPGGAQVRITAGGHVMLGAAAPSDAVAMASKVDANTMQLKTFANALATYALAIKTIADPTNAATPALTGAITALGTALEATGSATVKATP